jgi:hypothetical protein
MPHPKHANYDRKNREARNQAKRNAYQKQKAAGVKSPSKVTRLQPRTGERVPSYCREIMIHAAKVRKERYLLEHGRQLYERALEWYASVGREVPEDLAAAYLLKE